MTDQKEYLFYKNLVFIWSKKWILLIIPIIIALIVSAFSFFGSREYVGKAVYYTSTLDKDDLTNPLLLKEKYITEKENLKANFSVVSRGNVQIRVVGENKEDVQNELTLLGAQYFEDLQENYKIRYEQTENSLKFYEQNKEDVKAKDDLIDKEIEEASEELEDQIVSENYLELLSRSITMEEIVLEYENGAYRKNVDLEDFVEPKLLSEEITESDNYLVQNMFISFALSFFLTLIGIMLWRYIREARRALND
ncbi:hypothetical protein [Metabacillus halosaccharovorans]|uniref:hypothetical protein n=1 Tax=Metabacillus halosaccharovorans TaxID=930124 RepID=UPI000994C50E|nr:hypothetical protein [Metabacillus halosaccharovorans]